MNKVLRVLMVISSLWIGLSSTKAQVLCEENLVLINLTTGAFGNEVSFQILGSDSTVVFDSATAFPYLESNSPYTATVCLADGCYGVIMLDSFGDGWNGANLTVSYDNTMINIGTLLQGSFGVSAFTVNIEDPNCAAPAIFGCTDPNALNYYPAATEDNGSCLYPIECGVGQVAAQLYVCTFSNGIDVILDILDSQGNIVTTISGLGNSQIFYMDICLDPEECYTAIMSNGAGFNGWSGGYFWINSGGYQLINESLDYGLSIESANFSINGSCPYPGCTDPAALNYNAYANEDDGSCVYPEPCEGNPVQVIVYTGSWAFEMDWYILDGNGAIVFDNSDVYSNNYNYTYNLCLADGCYTLVLTDSFGDGWNGGVIYFNYANNEFNASIPYGNLFVQAFGINADECEADITFGCTNPEANNYDPEATIEDDSCTYDIYGCTDPLASNYDYWVNIDDGSCIYPEPCDGVYSQLYVCTFSNGLCVNLQILDSEGNEVIFVSELYSGQIAYFDLCLLPGECYSAVMSSPCGNGGWFNGYFWVNSGGYQLVNDYLDPGFDSQTVYFSIDGACPSIGCTDPEASNYDPAANEDDGSCVYPEPCFENNVTLNLSLGMFPNEVSWIVTGEDGVLYGSGGNYNGYSEVINLCLPDGCYTFEMFDSFGDGWNNAFASLTLNNEIIASGTLYQGSYDYFNFGVNTEGCEGEVEIAGCTDPVAANYDPNATIDNGTCVYFQDCELNAVYVVISTQNWGYEISWELTTEGGGEVVASGSGYNSWSYYTTELCLEDGCYELHMYDSWGDGWNGGYYAIISENNYNEGTLLYGDYTMDLISINGNCGITGCMDPEAINYNPQATVEDGSCVYNGGFGGDLGDFVNPELDFDFDYFPNPFFNEVQIVLNNLNPIEDLTIDMYDATGRIVSNMFYGKGREYFREEIQLNGLESGMYIVTVRNGDKIQTERLIKE